MKVLVRLQTTNQPIEFDADSVYEKGAMTCIATGGYEQVTKFPTDHIFSIVEEYGYANPAVKR